jgi:hypothetical protein
MNPAHKLLLENNLHKSHWGLRIISAENFGAFTPEDESDGSSWFFCACGKLDDHIILESSRFDKAPKDKLLFRLGVNFAEYVDVDIGDPSDFDVSRFYSAAECLIRIENRSIELLKESLE